MTSIEINHLCTILKKINYTATYKAWLNFVVVEYIIISRDCGVSDHYPLEERCMLLNR